MGGDPKPVKEFEPGEWKNLIPGILDEIGNYTYSQVLDNLQKAANAMQSKTRNDYWLTDEGQSDILRRIHKRSRPPASTSAYGTSTSIGSAITPTLSPLDYTQASNAMLEKKGLSAVKGEEEWVEIEPTADSGACDTVIPRAMADVIPIMPSLASLRGMEYKVANGQSIPNLGERRCLIWTEGATESKKINMQVADAHKGLLSLSRCAGMGLESRLGRRAGALVCETTGEVLPLARKGNLYVLRVWVKAAPFGRQDP